MSATIPITLTPIPVPVGVKATDINQLITIITQFTAASVNADVSFFQIVSADPTQMTTPLIFNTSQGVFKYWDTTVGKYTPVSQFQPVCGLSTSMYVFLMSPGWNWVIGMYLPSPVSQYLKTACAVLKISGVVSSDGSAATVWKNDTSAFIDAAVNCVMIVINWLMSVALTPIGTGTGVRVMGMVALIYGTGDW